MISEIVVLTLSEKWGGKCVAAYDLKFRKLLRVVSEPKEGAGIPAHLTSSIKHLDIVYVNILRECPVGHQTENVLIDLTYGLKKVGTIASIQQLAFLTNKGAPIFGDCCYKLSNVNGLQHSIELIEFESMSFLTGSNNKTKASFKKSGAEHSNYSVTDSRYFGHTSLINSGFAIVSLPPSDSFTNQGNGFFKFVSAIYSI